MRSGHRPHVGGTRTRPIPCDARNGGSSPLATPRSPVRYPVFHQLRPEPVDADAEILFIGNSLTAANNLPAVVNTVAEAAGLDVATRAVALGNFSLEDHWEEGIESFIRTAQADLVVIQQGPSSLPENQLHLLQ